MNYYILPKNTISCKIRANIIPKQELIPIICPSFMYYLYKTNHQLDGIASSSSCAEEIATYPISQFINPYEFLFSNVPGYSHSVSKLKTESNLLYELIEIWHGFNIKYVCSPNISSAHITDHYMDSMDVFHLYQEESIKEIYGFLFCVPKLLEHSFFTSSSSHIDYFFFECKEEECKVPHEYFKKTLVILYLIFTCQKEKGTTIIKMNTLFYKPILDMLYIISGCFEKVYLTKPIVANIISHERYVICKHFIKKDRTSIIVHLLETIYLLDRLDPSLTIDSLLENVHSAYFLTKVEESNIVIGQQQLDALHQIIHIFKNKNKHDKLESLKKNNIQKCIQWCEKFNISHHKFTDKMNIFLHNTNSKIVHETGTGLEEDELEEEEPVELEEVVEEK